MIKIKPLLFAPSVCVKYICRICLLLTVAMTGFLSACGSREEATLAPAASPSPIVRDLPDVPDTLDASSDALVASISDETYQELTTGTVTLTTSQLSDYATIEDCSVSQDQKTLSLSLTMKNIPQSDDSLVYLFYRNIYDAQMSFRTKPITSVLKGTDCTFTWAYQSDYLFESFVPALLINGSYVSIASGSFLTNPEVLARNQTDYPEASSKKGLLLDPEMLGTPELTDLGVAHAIYNIPLSIILGETTDETFPTISYDFQGTTYYFNGAAINGYDYLFSYLTDCGMLSTAIVLNDWNDAFPELVHPLARNQSSGAYYYAFNTADADGCKHLEAIASFLASRYDGGKYGLVSSWVIANEINQRSTWNYMDTTDITVYATAFEQSLRIFYNAIKSNYAQARVYFSVDHDWNTNDGTDDSYFNAMDLVSEINKAAAKNGSYDWGLAIHPYPKPLTRVNYWTLDYDKSVDAPLLTLMNLRTVTDYLSQDSLLDTRGQVRNITVTELGFSSTSGEKLQAAAFAYCYYIIENNPYIDAFIMNRQTDAKEEVRQGLAFGIYEYDHTPKYMKEVFQYIDTDRADEYLDFMLNILHADSLAEALSWAE